MEKSMLDVAYEIISAEDNPVSFKNLVEQIGEKLNLSEEELKGKLARFYTNLMLDGRFVTLGENTWDLRARNKFEKVHIDMNDVYKEDDEEAEEVEEEETVIEDVRDAEDVFTETGLKKGDSLPIDELEGE